VRQSLDPGQVRLQQPMVRPVRLKQCVTEAALKPS
jgi:hypothetical protein